MSAHRERLQRILIALAVLTLLVLTFGYSQFHRPGHYGIVEFIVGLGGVIFWFALVAYAVIIGMVVWASLAQRQSIWPAKYFIPAALALGIVTLYFGGRIFHTTTFKIWEASPAGINYSDVATIYQERCMTRVQDDENSSHLEDDWHAGAWVCHPLALRLHNLYPGPAWFFGSPPSADEDSDD